VKTLFLLLAQFDGRPIIPVDEVCRVYFPHLSPQKFLQKTTAGEIAMPVVRIEESQKAARGVHLEDLAAYLDARRAVALKEFKQLHRV